MGDAGGAAGASFARDGVKYVAPWRHGALPGSVSRLQDVAASADAVGSFAAAKCDRFHTRGAVIGIKVHRQIRLPPVVEAMSQLPVSATLAGRAVIGLALVAAAWGLTVRDAWAADRTISASTGTFDCSSLGPGDTITLESGTRGPLVIRNCNGTASNPIVIRNDTRGNGPTIIRRSSGNAGGYVFMCNTCIGVKIDGSYKWQGAPASKTYGIKVTMTGGGSPSAFLRVSGLSRFVTIRNVEVDGAWPGVADNGIGISVNDHGVKRSAYPNLWREGFLIEHNYVHNVEGEGMYVGPNYREGDLPLRNIEIRYNLVEDIGWEGINTKSMWEGDNSVHHNVVRRAGSNGSQTNKPTQYSGINNNGGTVKIYNNWVESTGQHGIQVWVQEGPRESEGKGPFRAEVWNNVIVRAGGLWRSHMAGSFGINVGAQDGCEKPVPLIYNNTIVDSRENGIRLTSNVGSGFVRDNIVANAGGNAITAPNYVDLINNRVGSVSQMGFEDPDRRNYRIRADSPARNNGGTAFPQYDYEDVSRPQDGAPDQGAYEHNDSRAADAAPQPPSALAVE
jgi:hypothetical protein